MMIPVHYDHQFQPSCQRIHIAFKTKFTYKILGIYNRVKYYFRCFYHEVHHGSSPKLIGLLLGPIETITSIRKFIIVHAVFFELLCAHGLMHTLTYIHTHRLNEHITAPSGGGNKIIWLINKNRFN
jgi:hypothetical protein